MTGRKSQKVRTKHVLTDIDPSTYTATCALCGHVKIRRATDMVQGWQCWRVAPSRREGRGHGIRGRPERGPDGIMMGECRVCGLVPVVIMSGVPRCSVSLAATRARTNARIKRWRQERREAGFRPRRGKESLAGVLGLAGGPRPVSDDEPPPPWAWPRPEAEPGPWGGVLVAGWRVARARGVAVPPVGWVISLDELGVISVHGPAPDRDGRETARAWVERVIGGPSVEAVAQAIVRVMGRAGINGPGGESSRGSAR